MAPRQHRPAATRGALLSLLTVAIVLLLLHRFVTAPYPTTRHLTSTPTSRAVVVRAVSTPQTVRLPIAVDTSRNASTAECAWHCLLLSQWGHAVAARISNVTSGDMDRHFYHGSSKKFLISLSLSNTFLTPSSSSLPFHMYLDSIFAPLLKRSVEQSTPPHSCPLLVLMGYSPEVPAAFAHYHRECRGVIMMVFTPPFLTYEDIAKIDRAVDDLGRDGSFLLWHLPVQHGRPGRFTPPHATDAKELGEAVTQVATLLASLGRFQPDFPAARRMSDTLRWFGHRTLYDPDFFSVTVQSPGEVVALREGDFLASNGLFEGLTDGEHRGEALPHIAYPTEEGSSFFTWNLSVGVPATCSETAAVQPDGAVFLHYPWARDNLYHTHNDNILPLILAAELVGIRDPSRRRLITLPSRRRNPPLPVFGAVAQHLFREHHIVSLPVRSAAERRVKSKRWDLCLALSQNATLVFGRPPRFFAKQIDVPSRYVVSGVFNTLRAEISLLYSVPNAPVCQASAGRSSHEIRVVWLGRKKRRRLLNAADVLRGLREAPDRLHLPNTTVRLVECCEGLSYADQVVLIAGADVLIGVHGAGLLHAIHLGLSNGTCRPNQQPKPLLFHLASRRMNYHEQTVIERIALALATEVRYRVSRTFTEADHTDAAWQNDFSLPADEAFAIGVDAIRAYLS